MFCSGMEEVPFAFQNSLSGNSGNGAHLSEGVGTLCGWGTNSTTPSPLLFGFSFLLPELSERKEPLKRSHF